MSEIKNGKLGLYGRV